MIFPLQICDHSARKLKEGGRKWHAGTGHIWKSRQLLSYIIMSELLLFTCSCLHVLCDFTVCSGKAAGQSTVNVGHEAKWNSAWIASHNPAFTLASNKLTANCSSFCVWVWYGAMISATTAGNSEMRFSKFLQIRYDTVNQPILTMLTGSNNSANKLHGMHSATIIWFSFSQLQSLFESNKWNKNL